jgi:hypothetical protein
MMRQKVQDALTLNTQIRDVDVGFFDSGNWQNYSRNYPTGAFNVYLRGAYGGGATANSTLEEVTGGVGNADANHQHTGRILGPETPAAGSLIPGLRSGMRRVISCASTSVVSRLCDIQRGPMARATRIS